jgi:H+/gluconate symporter-like permease
MPLPHPPGYQPPRQSQVDRRRVLLAAMVLAVLAVLLLVLGRRAAAHAGNALAQPSLERSLAVVLVAAGCGAWGETMRQLAGIARASDSEG